MSVTPLKRKASQLEGYNNKMLVPRVRFYTKVTMYFFGDPRGAQPSDTYPTCLTEAEAALQACHTRVTKAYDDLKACWVEYGHYEAHIVDVLNDTEVSDFITTLCLHGRDELVMIVYCGVAGGEDYAYRWTYPGCPPGGFNARRLLSAAEKCRTDVHFILDAYMQTRPTKPLKRPPGKGNLEVLLCPHPMQDTEGKPMIQHVGHMLESLTRQWTHYNHQVCGLDEHIDLNILGPGGDRLLSASQISIGDDEMYSNYIHIFGNRPYGDQETVIERIKLHPRSTKETGRNIWCAEEIQGPGQVKPIAKTPAKLIKDIAIYCQLLYERGQLKAEWSETKKELEPFDQTVRRMARAGLFEFFRDIRDFTTLTASNSKSGQPDLVIDFSNISEVDLDADSDVEVGANEDSERGNTDVRHKRAKVTHLREHELNMGFLEFARHL